MICSKDLLIIFQVLLLVDCSYQEEDNLLVFFNATNSEAISDYPVLKGNMIQYRNGEIFIGGLIRVHKRGEREHCAGIQQDGVEAVEAMNEVLDKINQDPNLLGNTSLGTVMIDTCDLDTHAINRVVNVMMPFFDENPNPSIPLFAGAVGAMSSSVSVQTGSFLQIFKIPQVSPLSTHPDLSDKKRFPYFFRTVPSDRFQASAIVQLLLQQEWTYVSVVYEDDDYGLQGFQELEVEVRLHGICLASTAAVRRNPTEMDFKKIVQALLDTKQAKGNYKIVAPLR